MTGLASLATHPHVRELVRRAETAEADSRALRRQVRELHEQVRTDPLTGITNRLGLTEQFTTRTGPVCSVLMIDLDGFKAINDTHGHRIGDLVLLETAHRLRNSALPGEVPVRISGDEFVLWLPPAAGFMTATFAAEDRAHQVRQVISTPIDINDDRIQVTASIGAAVVTNPTRLEDVLAPADHDMYSHKPHAARHR